MPVFLAPVKSPDVSLGSSGTAWPAAFGAPVGIGRGEQFAIPGITVDPQIMGGTPCIEGTRIPVFVVLEMLEGGSTEDDIYRNFPRITRRDQIDAARRYGAFHPARSSHPSAAL